MALKWYQDNEGHASSMRIIAMLGGVTGCIAVLAGCVAVFMRIPDGAILATVGAGMTGLGEIAKSWQAQKGA
jgi:hypothetical protein